MEVIPQIEGMFDLVFIDADKRNYPNYYRLVRERMQPGGWIPADNVLWSGKIVQPQEKMDADTRALAAFNDAVHADPQAGSFSSPIRWNPDYSHAELNRRILSSSNPQFQRP